MTNDLGEQREILLRRYEPGRDKVGRPFEQRARMRPDGSVSIWCVYDGDNGSFAGTTLCQDEVSVLLKWLVAHASTTGMTDEPWLCGDCGSPNPATSGKCSACGYVIGPVAATTGGGPRDKPAVASTATSAVNFPGCRKRIVCGADGKCSVCIDMEAPATAVASLRSAREADDVFVGPEQFNATVGVFCAWLRSRGHAGLADDLACVAPERLAEIARVDRASRGGAP